MLVVVCVSAQIILLYLPDQLAISSKNSKSEKAAININITTAILKLLKMELIVPMQSTQNETKLQTNDLSCEVYSPTLLYKWRGRAVWVPGPCAAPN